MADYTITLTDKSIVEGSISVTTGAGDVYKEVENLFLADSSIMPHCIRANTNVTTMMIGERMSDFFKDII